MSLLLTACGVFYGLQTFNFLANYERGDYANAEAALIDIKEKHIKKYEFVYYSNLGVVTAFQGRNLESNEHFEKAYLFREDYAVSPIEIVNSLLVNPYLRDYPGEDHEHLLLLYYKALNYLLLGEMESALVEVRRMDIRLSQLEDKYRRDKRYQKDAFIQTVMGLVYDAAGDFNNAFIAYRNALEVYDNEYSEWFGLQAPLQLKKDLLRCAHKSGFYEDLAEFEKQFAMDYTPDKDPKGDLVYFWHRGLAPIKGQSFITFVKVTDDVGVVSFTNSDLGIALPVFLGDGEDGGLNENEMNSLDEIEFFRMAIPRYVERPTRWTRAHLITGGQKFDLEMAENVSDLSFLVLKQRMARELGETVARFLVKNLIRQTLEEESEGAGLLSEVYNFVSETADLRCWESLPSGIHYSRLSLPQGSHTVDLVLEGEDANSLTIPVDFEIQSYRTQFFAYQDIVTDSMLKPESPGFREGMLQDLQDTSPEGEEMRRQREEWRLKREQKKRG